MYLTSLYLRQVSSAATKEMKACASVSAGYKGPFVEASMDAEGCKESKSSSKSGDKKKTDSTKVISIGSKPFKNGAGKKRLPLCPAILTYYLLVHRVG